MSDSPEAALQAAFPFIRVVVRDVVPASEYWLLPTVEQANRWLDRARPALEAYRDQGGKLSWIAAYEDRIRRVERSMNWYALIDK